MNRATDKLKRVGEALASLRSRRNLSQNELARLTAVAQGTISNIEAGRTCQLDILLVLLEALDTPADVFCYEAGLTGKSSGVHEYTMTITFEANRLRSIAGNVEGYGLTTRVKR